MSKYNNTILAIVAIALSLTLVFAENLVPAYAFSVTYKASGLASISSIAWKDGEENLAIGSSNTDNVTIRTQSTNALVGTVAGITDPTFGFTVATQANRAYFIGGAAGVTVYEIDLVNAVLLRSASNGCSVATQGVYVDSANGNLYCATGTSTINRFSISSFTVTFTSTTLNAGATPCAGVEAMSYNSATDTLFAGCSSAGNIVAVIGLATSGTPDFSIAYSTTISGMAFNNRESNVAVCASGAVTPRIYNYSASTGFALFLAIGATTDTCSANEYAGRMVYDRQSDRFFQAGTGNTQVRIMDGTNGDNLVSTVITNNVGMIIPVSNTELIGVAGAGNYFVMDLTGIPLGSNGETPSGGGGSGGIDCTLPENEQILICRLGDNPDCNGTVLGCAGNFIIGNTTGDTGLTPIICSVGFVDCVANPDMKTNGVGYLLVTIALAIIIGILWVASRGDLNSIPTFIWFVATLAVVGAFTLMDLIDATFLVITAIIVVALAAAKVRGLFGGEFR